MTDPNFLRVLWSKAAAEAAGPNIAALQAKLLAEARDIVEGAQGWFLHALPHEGVDDCFQCTGDKLEDHWKIFVQVAVYKPMAPLPDDHPDPERRGKVFKFPEVVEGPDNEVFAPFEDVAASAA